MIVFYTHEWNREEEVYEYSKIFKISDELFQQYKIDLLDQL